MNKEERGQRAAGHAGCQLQLYYLLSTTSTTSQPQEVYLFKLDELLNSVFNFPPPPKIGNLSPLVKFSGVPRLQSCITGNSRNDDRQSSVPKVGAHNIKAQQGGMTVDPADVYYTQMQRILYTHPPKYRSRSWV